MGMVDQAVINFACYEDAKDFLGLASVKSEAKRS